MKHYCARRNPGVTFLQTPFSPFNFKPSAISKKKKNTFLTLFKICQTIFDGIYFKKPIDKGLLF